MDKKNKKPFYKRIWVWVLAVIVLMIIGGAGSSSNTATKVAEQGSNTSASTTTEFKTGDIIDFDNKKVTVTSVERNWSSGNEYIVPDSGNEFLKVTITIQNNSNSEASYNTFDWKLQNSSGVIKDVDSMTYSVDNSLSSGQLAAGGKITGSIIFQAKAGDAGLSLHYAPSFWSDKKITIKI